MIDALRWLIAVEVVGLVFLPLAMWMCRALPDRGYGLAKTFGLVLLTFGTWIVGEFLPVAAGIWLPLIVLAAGSTLSWWLFGDEVARAWKDIRTTLVVEEAIFLIAFVTWCLLRAYVFHPGISHTEQYMDMSILAASVRSASYPPYDPWMSGHSINYYYLGYLMYSLLIKLSGVLPSIGYNLALSTLFATVVANCYSVGLALIRRLLPALAAPVAVALLGNWHLILVQIPSGDAPGSFSWFWNSTRVIGPNNATVTSSITEFPFFSYMLGDLHPHVMALPVTILTIGLGLTFLFDRHALRLARNWQTWLRLIMTAICIGSLFVMNSWDFPTYGVLVAGCIFIAAYLNNETESWWQQPAKVAVVLAAAAVAAYLPFYLQFRAPSGGFGMVTTPSNPWEFLQVFGLFALPCAVLLAGYALLYQPAGDEDAQTDSAPVSERTSALEAGAVRVADSSLYVGAVVLIFAVLGIRFHIWVLLALLLASATALAMLHRALNTEEPNRADAAALALIALGCLVLAVPEVVYIRDAFDGGASYRMNTMFKFDYQGWALLGLASAYAVVRAAGIFRSLLGRPVGIAVILLAAVCAAGGALYTVTAPQSFNWGGTAIGLDGMAALQESPPQSQDYGAIVWLRDHATGSPVELEATGGGYQADSARVSAFTGLPTVMGWSDHEYQWRGGDAEIGARVAAVNTIYTTRSAATAETLLRQYRVQYVFVGSAERAIRNADLSKFGRFMRVAYHDSTDTIYTW